MFRKWLGVLSVIVGAVVASASSGLAQAQTEPIRIGFLTVRSGALAAGGRQMEEGIQLFLKERNNTIAGRKVELIIADTGGNPAGDGLQELAPWSFAGGCGEQMICTSLTAR